MVIRDAKTIYAQSSDIRSRTYIEYRRDMKKKAIAELEVLDWIPHALEREFPGKKIRVQKSGGDKFIWFLRAGGITREPDYKAQIGDERLFLEFQYADRADLPYYDFKLSKIATRVRGQTKRVPHHNKLIIYIVKPLASYALLTPGWIVDNAEIGGVPAWGDRSAYRVPRDRFLAVLKKDPSLSDWLASIDAKNLILEFQHGLIDLMKDHLSHLLQGVIDEKKLVSIVPEDLDSFFKVCFILEHIDRTPLNANLWLVYVQAYLDSELDTETCFKVSYCLDFLYPRAVLKSHEIAGLVRTVNRLSSLLASFAQDTGLFSSSLKLSPLEETRYALFSLNVLEDLTQDMIHYYDAEGLQPITKIYQSVPFLDQTARLIASSHHS